MNFPMAVKTCFKKYATFSGRASRSEYWYWVLFFILIDLLIWGVDATVFHTVITTCTETNGGVTNGGTTFCQTHDEGLLQTLFFLISSLPGLTVAVRRLHDVDHSGWWLLLWFIPFVGWFFILHWAATKGTAGPNRFGPDPLA